MHAQIFTQKAKIQPRQTFTLRQIIERSEAGNLPPISKEPQFFGEIEDPPVYRDFDYDIVDIENALKLSADRYKESLGLDIKEKQESSALDEKKAASQKRLDKLLAMEEKSVETPTSKPMKYSDLQEIKELKRFLNS